MASRRGLLLDTSVFIWAGTHFERISSSAVSQISDPEENLFVSIASVLEMQIKHGLGKLPLVDEADRVARRLAASLDVEFLYVTLDHLSALYRLPSIHRDPFDRLLAAQSIVEGLTLLSPDPVFKRYPVELLW